MSVHDHEREPQAAPPAGAPGAPGPGGAPGAGGAAPSPYEDGELYDLVFSAYREDLDFYLGLARRARGPVLEVGCGTGRVLLPLLEAGVDADGIDLHAGMLDALKRKAAARALKPRVIQADMRDFTMPRRYALILVTFNGFLHNLTTEDQLRTLRVCREHLEGGGMLVVAAFHPSRKLLGEPDGEPVLEMEVPHARNGVTLRLYDTRSKDMVNQIQRSKNEIHEVDAAGNVVAVHRSETATRWIYKSEMELLLRVAGFQRWQLLGGFDGHPLEREDDLMIATAWKD